MGRSQSLGVRSSRWGLMLIWIGSTILAYFLFAQSAIATGLIPRVMAFDFFGFAGFMAVIILAILELGILRWAIHTQADNLALFYLFFAVSVITCAMSYFNADTIVSLLAWVSSNARWILIGSAVIIFAGLAYCLVAGGSFLNWLLGVAAMVCLAGAFAFLLAVIDSQFLKGPLKSIVKQIPVFGSQGTTASLFAGAALFFHVIYIRNIARRFRDDSLAESSRLFQILLVVGTLMISTCVLRIGNHEVNPALRVGDAVYDTHQLVLRSMVCLVAGLLGIFYSRLVASTRMLIDLSSRR